MWDARQRGGAEPVMTQHPIVRHNKPQRAPVYAIRDTKMAKRGTFSITNDGEREREREYELSNGNGIE